MQVKFVTPLLKSVPGYSFRVYWRTHLGRIYPALSAQEWLVRRFCHMFKTYIWFGIEKVLRASRLPPSLGLVVTGAVNYDCQKTLTSSCLPQHWIATCWQVIFFLVHFAGGKGRIQMPWKWIGQVVSFTVSHVNGMCSFIHWVPAIRMGHVVFYQCDQVHVIDHGSFEWDTYFIHRCVAYEWDA